MKISNVSSINQKVTKQANPTLSHSIEVISDDLDLLDDAVNYLTLVRRRNKDNTLNLSSARVIFELQTSIIETASTIRAKFNPECILSHPYFEDLVSWIQHSASMTELASVLHHIPAHILKDVTPSFGKERLKSEFPYSKLLVASAIFSTDDHAHQKPN